MATPIGHCLLSYSVYSVAGKTTEESNAILWACLFLSVAPDFDFIPGILQGQPNLYHQGISHSLGAALGTSAIAALIIRTDFWRCWGLCFVAYASHLALDACVPDGRPPFGQPLFWPIINCHYSAPESLHILLGVRHHASTNAPLADWFGGILHLQNLAAVALELLVTFPIVFCARIVGRRVANKRHLFGRKRDLTIDKKQMSS